MWMQQAEDQEPDIAGQGQDPQRHHVLLIMTGRIERTAEKADSYGEVNVHGTGSL